MMDPAVGRFTGVDPLAEKYAAWSPFSYTFDNPIRFIDPTGMAPEWIPSTDKSGNIILTAESGDDYESLKDFFVTDEAFNRFVPKSAKKRNFKKGDVLYLKDNIFSQSIRNARSNPDIFKSDDNDNTYKENYDCKTFAIITGIYKVAAEATDISISDPYTFGKIWSSKDKIDSSEKVPGETISYWNWAAGLLFDHAAIHFGFDNSEMEYFITKNGTTREPKVSSYKDLPYSLMWFRSDYKGNDKWKNQ